MDWSKAMQNLVQFNVPFEALVEAVKSLDLNHKRQLLEVLEDLLFDLEEESMEQNPQVLLEVEEARKAYQAGDYQTIQDYIAKQPTSS